MMRDDNRVFVRMRGRWSVEDPGYAPDVTPADGWPRLSYGQRMYSDFIIWRGRIVKDRWDRFNLDEFLAELREQGIPVEP
jgi:hypothetical protein